MSQTMDCEIKVLFFASLREQVGRAELLIHATSIGDVMAALRAMLSASAIESLEQENVRIAVNQQLIDGEISLKQGDEVAFLPPITGG